jgi:hypothetical protein
MKRTVFVGLPIAAVMLIGSVQGAYACQNNLSNARDQAASTSCSSEQFNPTTGYNPPPKLRTESNDPAAYELENVQITSYQIGVL